MKAHYNQEIRIRRPDGVTHIPAGYASCRPGRLVDYSTHVRAEVTCKLCLHLMAKGETPGFTGPFSRMSRDGRLLALKCRACGVKMSGPCIEPICKKCGGVDHIVLRVPRATEKRSTR